MFGLEGSIARNFTTFVANFVTLVVNEAKKPTAAFTEPMIELLAPQQPPASPRASQTWCRPMASGNELLEAIMSLTPFVYAVERAR